MADADQRHGQAGRGAARRAATDAEGGRQLAGGELHRGEQREAGRGDRAGDDGGKAFGILFTPPIEPEPTLSTSAAATPSG